MKDLLMLAIIGVGIALIVCLILWCKSQVDKDE
jgi:hypothetical protein